MAWQKNKILLISVETIIDDKGNERKIYDRYVVTKSKGGAGKQLGKLKLKKYNKKLRKHTLYTEAKYK
jgi:ribosomal protein L33